MGPGSRLAGAAALAVVASGCFWPAPGAGPDRAGHNPLEDRITRETVADLEEVWTARIGGGGETDEVRSPVTSYEAVHVAAGSTLYGFDTRTGDRLWSRVPDNSAPNWEMGAATFANGVLWSGSGEPFRDGYVTELLDPDTGDVVGDPGADGLVDSVRGDGYLLNRVILVGTGLGTLTIEVRDGGEPELGWSARIAIGSGSWQPLTLGDDFVYQAGSGLSVDERGDVVASNGLRGYSTEEQPEECPPDDEIFITVYCPTWFTPLEGSAESPVLDPDGSTVFVGTGTFDGEVGAAYALDAHTGEVLWSAPVGNAVAAEPALARGSLFVPTVDGRVVALDAGTGEVLWTTGERGAGLGAQPAVAGGLVFTAASDGTVEAFDAAGCGTKSCEPLWSDSLGSEITGAPAVSDGQLYVGTADGRLVAYGLP